MWQTLHKTLGIFSDITDGGLDIGVLFVVPHRKCSIVDLSLTRRSGYPLSKYINVSMADDSV